MFWFSKTSRFVSFALFFRKSIVKTFYIAVNSISLAPGEDVCDEQLKFGFNPKRAGRFCNFSKKIKSSISAQLRTTTRGTNYSAFERPGVVNSV